MIQVPFFNTPWDMKFIEIGGKKYDPNDIEHGILRKSFNEPRIHFAINCGSISCPILRNEAYQADKIEEQLEEQAFEFFGDTTKNSISGDKVYLSKIFQWSHRYFTYKV